MARVPCHEGRTSSCAVCIRSGSTLTTKVPNTTKNAAMMMATTNFHSRPQYADVASMRSRQPSTAACAKSASASIIHTSTKFATTSAKECQLPNALPVADANVPPSEMDGNAIWNICKRVSARVPSTNARSATMIAFWFVEKRDAASTSAPNSTHTNASVSDSSPVPTRDTDEAPETTVEIA